jgi:hypothetical protein
MAVLRVFWVLWIFHIVNPFDPFDPWWLLFFPLIRIARGTLGCAAAEEN